MIHRFRIEFALVLGLLTVGLLIAPLLPFRLASQGPRLCVFCVMGVERIFDVIGVQGGCPGCGMSRALWALLHGSTAKALVLNWRVIFVAPILVLCFFNLGSQVFGSRFYCSNL